MHKLAFGQAGMGERRVNFCGRTISASGLRPWGTESASGICPGGQICSTPVVKLGLASYKWQSLFA